MYFNPCSREGSDKEKSGSCAGTKISIHAPARGATANLHNYSNISLRKTQHYHLISVLFFLKPCPFIKISYSSFSANLPLFSCSHRSRTFSTTITSAGNQSTESSSSIASHFAASCSRKIKFPETTSAQKQSMER